MVWCGVVWCVCVCVCVLQFGTNDALEEIWNEQQFIADYTAMITAFKDLPSSPRYSRLLSRPLI